MTRPRAARSVPIHGPALRHLRTQAGLTISELARAADVSTGFLSRVELGVKRAVGEDVFRVLVTELALTDPRLVVADPYSDRVAHLTVVSTAGSSPEAQNELQCGSTASTTRVA